MKKIAIIGAGISGLFIANLFKKNPDDYVIATGKNYSVKQFINLVAKKLKITLFWKGKGINAKAYDQNKNLIIVPFVDKIEELYSITDLIVSSI